jgi:hypothetical protein
MASEFGDKWFTSRWVSGGRVRSRILEASAAQTGTVVAIKG